MSIKAAILGILSWKSSTGYEIKKMFEESSILYWSGNNNQIYKALSQMLDEDLVQSELVHQDSSPSKKIYTITDEGLKELKEWILSSPEAPEMKKSFLIQLAWSNVLSDNELNDLFLKYEMEIKSQLLMEQEKIRRAVYSPNRNPRELFIWDMISENIISTYNNELKWTMESRQKLIEKQMIEEKEKMNYKIIENDKKKYIEIISSTLPLSTENDALDLVALSREYDTGLLMIHYDALSEDFFNLKTKSAGLMIQKFVNYGIKTAVVLPSELILKGSFKKMYTETNRGNHFRMYQNKDDAEKWLLQ